MRRNYLQLQIFCLKCVVLGFLSISGSLTYFLWGQTAKQAPSRAHEASVAPAIPPTYATHPEIVQFMHFMVDKHGYALAELTQLFAQLKVDKKTEQRLVAYTNQAPEVKKDWARYRKQFLTTERIARGRLFGRRNRAQLRKVAQKYGVPPQIITATLGMESFYGVRSGKLGILRSLTTFVAEKGRRHKFYTRQLEHYLLFCNQYNHDPLLLTGSYSGAMGPAQFIPSTAVHYARDGDNDDNIDLFANFDDIIESIGYYYKKCGWQAKQPIARRYKRLPPQLAPSDFTTQVKRSPTKNSYFLVEIADKVEYWRFYANYKSIKCYNNSDLYALTLFQLSKAY